ncbi:lipopolysaccharide-induced tumor necrosis factor-alpha factor homolog [Podarcis raffonei]|uniref:lipopolysaccharide-induced tumor necrosis factor-alpha factor homolog n=1 Tax=Podarcis raffonei TaxID=65483 RepID=UPI0023295F52|nr:lipopolysaccharide-induced tumor necrosis factor-alpha factor homolog [Podarcis raffonei]
MEQQKKTVSIPMMPLAQQPEPFAPGYSSPYPQQSSYNPEPYAQEPYAQEPYAPDPFWPEPSTSSGGYGYGKSGDGYDCPSPPPYSCQDVPCDQVGPIEMDSGPPVVVAGIFSSKPASTICPCCRQIITTEVVYRVGTLTYIACSAVCVMGGCMGCCLIPFMTNCCKDVDHYCPKCRYHIYRYKRL